MKSRVGEIGESTEALPSFCGRCGREGTPGATLCAECGEGLLGQGFCPVCERFWRLPEGAHCPKHDLALTAAPLPSKPALGDDEAIDWVTVGSFAIPMEAEARRLRLEAEGIPTFLDGARMGANAIYAVATGGIKLQVPRALVPEARVLLSQSWAIPAHPDDLEDAWDELEPEPGAAISPIGWGQVVALGVLVAAGLVYVAYRSF